MSTQLPVSDRSSDVLPPLYAGWINELLGRPIPPETQATCRDCIMCQPAQGSNAKAGFFFNPQTKCCTYLPRLSNFLVGRILGDGDPALVRGRRILEQQLDAAISVTPLGVGRRPIDDLHYKHLQETAGFGRSREISCPYYQLETGLCGIWRHRESTCATWFCKHVRGEKGFVFWRTVQQLIAQIEREIAAWCVLELDPGEDALQYIFRPKGIRESDPFSAGQSDGIPAPAVRRAIWWRYAGRAREFYQGCAELAATLKWSDVLKISGSEVRALATSTQAAFGRLTSTEPSPRLIAVPYTIVQAHTQTVRVEGYSPTDPIDVPKPVMDCLVLFDGRRTDDVLNEIVIRQRIRLDPALIAKLEDFRILQPTEIPTSLSENAGA